MKKILFLALAAGTVFSASAAKQKKAEADSTFKFTDVKVVKTTPVKNQNRSGTCWSFSTVSFLEDEVMRAGGPELDLADMWPVRLCYNDKSIKYVRTDGLNSNLSQGGAAEDVIYVLRNYGFVPESAYPGLNYGEKKHDHGELESGVKGYIDGVRKGSRKRTTAWKAGLNGILDAYFGQMPQSFVYEGKTYTPRTFADEVMKLNPDNYVSITSFTHHPFYTQFPLEVSDNWLWAPSWNVKMEDMERIVDNAIENGYTVAWGADVSEPGFQYNKGFAVLNEPITEGDLEGTELSRWVKLTPQEKAKRNQVTGPNYKRKKVTQESRQAAFDNKETTDDHGMVIVGIAKDQNGEKYYKVKNSWDTTQVYGGFFYMSVPYLLEKTTTLMVNKNALPADLAEKLK